MAVSVSKNVSRDSSRHVPEGKQLTADEQATMLESELRPDFDTEIRGACFSPIPGLKMVTSVKPDFFHHGLPVTEEPCAGMEAPANRNGHLRPIEEEVGARIPGDVTPGEATLDVASESLLLPHIERQNLSEAERSYDDWRHISRGGSQMASR